MARPTEFPDRRQTSLRIDPELLERLDKAADERGLARNWLACKLLEEGLNRLIPASEFRLFRDSPGPVVGQTPAPTDRPEGPGRDPA